MKIPKFEDITLEELKRYRDFTHDLAEFYSVHTRHMELKAEGRTELADAYYNYAQRLYNKLPAKWIVSFE